MVNLNSDNDHKQQVSASHTGNHPACFQMGVCSIFDTFHLKKAYKEIGACHLRAWLPCGFTTTVLIGFYLSSRSLWSQMHFNILCSTLLSFCWNYFQHWIMWISLETILKLFPFQFFYDSEECNVNPKIKLRNSTVR